MGLDTHTVIVDKGAIPHIINGADVMCPGIVNADENIGEGDYVIIKEESHRKPLAIGYALIPGSSMRAGSGKAIKTIHYVGDDLWNINA
ncbi:PUA domain-containing protein [Methanosalsum zhilinae]|uniref:PUA domain-containing protein n=1 Tax=Methanosalsum zhilinae TaxID=39669 RepID=UPI00315C9818